MASVLIVDDEPAICESVAYALGREGFEARVAATLAAAEQVWRDVDLIVLDLMLPDGSGVDFLKNVRQQSNVAVILLTSRDEEIDRVLGLELGADDYVGKPFSPRELVARIRAVLRRTASGDATASGPSAESTGRMSWDRRPTRPTESMIRVERFRGSNVSGCPKGADPGATGPGSAIS